MTSNGFSIKPLKVKLLAGEQKATERGYVGRSCSDGETWEKCHRNGGSLPESQEAKVHVLVGMSQVDASWDRK